MTPRPSPFAVAALATLLGLLRPLSVAAQTPPIGPVVPAWQPNGVVNALLLDGSTLYVGGSFDQVGPRTGTFAAIDAADASAVTSGAEISFAIDVVAADGLGGWFAAGRNRNPSPPNPPGPVILHILQNGQRDPAWTPPTLDPFADGGNVVAMAVDAGRLFIGGTFSSVNGAQRWGVAALDASSGALLPWNAQLTRGAPGGQLPIVSRLTVAAGRVYVAGQFDAAGGIARNRMAILDPSTAAPLPGTLPAALTDASIEQIAVSATRVYLQGRCRDAERVICAYDLDLMPVPGWTFPPSSGPIAASASAVYSSEVTGGLPFQRRRLTKHDPNTGAIVAWNAPELGGQFAATTEPSVMQVFGDRLYVGGNFTDVNGEARLRVAAVDATSGVLQPWAPLVGGQVLGLAATTSSIAIGGTFPSIGGVARRNLVAIDLRTGRPGPPTPMIELDVRAMLKLGTAVVIGGYRSPFSAGGDLTAFSTTTGALIPWSLSSNGWVGALATDGRRVYVGGFFSALSGTPRSHLAAIDIGTGAITPWNPSPDGPVTTLAVSGGALYAAGSFTTLTGYGRMGVAAFATASDDVLSFDPRLAAADLIRGFAFHDNRVLLVGEPNGINRGGFRWVDRISGTTLALSSATPLGFRAESSAQANGTVYAVRRIEGTTGLASVDVASGRTELWDSRIGLGGAVVAATADFVAVGGGFGSFGLGPISETLKVFQAPPAGTPERMTASVVNSTVTLGWQAGPPPAATTYQVEAGTTFGATDVGVFAVGLATRVSGTLPAGTYYTRVRGVGTTGPGAASSEVIVTVPSTSTPPNAPGTLNASVVPSGFASGTVTLRWGAASGNATTYVIEAGTASGITNIGALPTGSLDTAFTTTAPAGTYFVRVRAANGFGVSPPSNEVTVVVP